MELTSEQIRWILIYVFVLLISVALHEFGHAVMADKLGDDTPRRQGRVTLNPLAHADPIGTLLLPLIGSVYGAASGMGGGIGWGKPVEWLPHRIRRGISMSTAKVLVSIAGPGMNVVLAVAIAGVHALLIALHVIPSVAEVYRSGEETSEIHRILFFAVNVNFGLFFFNLLPIPPLDGGHVLQSFVPYRHRDRYDNLVKYAPFVLLAVLLIPQVRQVFAWPASYCARHLYHLFGIA